MLAGSTVNSTDSMGGERHEAAVGFRKGSSRGGRPRGGRPTEAAAEDGWKQRPYASIGGGSGFIRVVTPSRSDVGLALGSEAGFLFAQREGPINARVRVGATWAGGVAASASDLRLGAFAGLRGDMLGLEIGADLFEGEVASKGFDLPSSRGLELPLKLTVGPDLVNGFVSISPAFVGEAARHVERGDDSWMVALGDELELKVGGSVSLPLFRLSAFYSEREVVGGKVQRLGFGVDL